MAYRVKPNSDDMSVLNEIDKKPDTCPACGKGIDPIFCYQYGVNLRQGYDGFLQIIFRCTKNNCQRLFVAIYTETFPRGYTDQLYLKKTLLVDFMEFEEFSEYITKISEQFPRIYNQSKIAEENGLDMIAGPSYRKALEFLVKDYIKKNDPKAFEKAKNMQLGSAIQLIENERIREMAERATWLGNDETHYIKKFKENDLEDLKNLIKMVAAWIELTERSDHYKKTLVSKKVKE